MPEKTEETKSKTEEELKSLFENTRKVILAGIGAVALAQDELEEFITRLIERGEIAERDGRNLMQEARDKRKKRMEKIEGEFTKKVEDVLKRADVPSKSDIQALSNKIAALSKKIDEMKKNP